MTPLCKEAFYWLILLAVTVAAYAVLAMLIGPGRACGAFGLFGLGGLLPLVYREHGQTVALDERDQQIGIRALVAGYSIFWLYFTLGITGLWAALCYEGQATVSVHLLPQIVGGGGLLFFTARAVAILVQYRLQAAEKGE